MIKIRIRHDDHEIDVRFPISESELFAKLGEIHAVEGRDAAQSALVTEIYSWLDDISSQPLLEKLLSLFADDLDSWMPMSSVKKSTERSEKPRRLPSEHL